MKNLARKLAWLTLIPAFIVSTAASAIGITGNVSTVRVSTEFIIVVVVNATDSMMCLVPFAPPTAAHAGMAAILSSAKAAGKVVSMTCDSTYGLHGVRVD